MAAISSLGVGSGLDIANIVKSLVDAEGKATNDRLNRREVEFQTQLTSLGNLKSALSDFSSTYSSLKLSSTFETTSINLSNSSYFTASSIGTVETGSHTVEVKQLATAQKLSSGTFAASNSTVGTGTLTIDFGAYAYDGSGNVTGFTANPNKTSATIDITDGSLTGIKKAINDAKIGVTASIINDGSGYRLVLSSETGAENAIKVSVTGDSDGNDSDNAGLSSLTYDPLGTGAFLTENVAAQDSIAAIDGIDITNSSNTVSGALTNITLNLTAASVGSVVNLTVSKDTSNVESAISKFVDGYNNLIKSLNDVTYYDPKTQTHGPLIGDASVRGIYQQLRSILNTTIKPSSSTTYDSFASLGILTTKDGTLEFDSSKLSTALASHPDEVKALLAGGASPSKDDQIVYKYIPSSLKEGNISVDITQLATQGNYTGTAAGGGFDLSAGSYTFNVTVDGVASGLITLANSNYGSGALVATHIQQMINNDATLKSAGKGVNVSYDTGSGSYIITSNIYGNNSQVNISSESADVSTVLGIGSAIGTKTTGIDVAGSIGGVAATGNGQSLSGSGNYVGVLLDVLGGSLGTRSSIKFNDGLIDKLGTVVDDMLASTGLLGTKTDGINNSILDIEQQRLKLAERLTALQQRYVAQFTAMDSLVAQLNSTGSFLTNQLASLPGARKN